MILTVAHPPLAAAYRAIDPAMSDRDITLTGHDLTVDQLVAVARYGAMVALSPEAQRNQKDAHGLLIQGAIEGVPIEGFNRPTADGKEGPAFAGDPTTPENQALIAGRQMQLFQSGIAGSGPEIDDEETVRALMTVRANTLTYSAASLPVTQALVDFLNNRIVPVVQGETADQPAGISPLRSVAAAIAGRGDVYYRGARMPAAQAIGQAGLTPVEPTGIDYQVLVDTNAFDVSRAGLLAFEAQHALNWADLIAAMDLNGVNGSLAPLSLPAQSNRPFKWLNWDAARLLDMIGGGYLFESDPKPPVRNLDSLPISSGRQGSAWRAWGGLRKEILAELNSSDSSTAIRLDLKQHDADELGAPQLMKYYVKGGKSSNGRHGFIVPTANRDPYPMANEVAAFTLALANMDAAVLRRVQQLGAPFSLSGEPAAGEDAQAGDVWRDIETLAQTNLKAQPGPRIDAARRMVDDTLHLLAMDLANAAAWLDMGIGQDPERKFGAAPTAAWEAFRKLVPPQPDTAQAANPAARAAAYDFLKANALESFYPKGEPPPETNDPIPLAQGKIRK